MPRSFNKITLVGYAGRDPQARSLPDGTSVCDFSLATNERRRGEEESATWFRINVFGSRADFVREYVKKGSFLYVEGSLSQRDYQGRDGTQKSSLEVRAGEIQLLDKREDGNGRPGVPVSHADVAQAAAAFDDEVPF